MTRRSRRKTLSHAEIESFLLDLDEEEGQELGGRGKQEVEVEVEVRGSEEEAVPEVSKEEEERMYRAKVVRAFCKVRRLTDCLLMLCLVSWVDLVTAGSPSCEAQGQLPAQCDCLCEDNL